MKKNLFIALLLSFFLGACGGESVKCDNKVALEILESLIKKEDIGIGFSRLMEPEAYKAEVYKAEEEYARKNTKIEFSNFRTEAKDEFSCLCVAKIKVITPTPKNKEVNYYDFSYVRGIEPNSIKELDNVRYSIRLTDDKKQVYAGFINLRKW